MLTSKEVRNIKRVCAVCGDCCKTNVRYLYRRDSDGLLFNMCAACREDGKPENAADLNPDIPNVVWKHEIEEHPTYRDCAKWGTCVNGENSRHPNYVSLPMVQYHRNCRRLG